MWDNYQNIAIELNKSIADLEKDIAVSEPKQVEAYPVHVRFIEFQKVEMNMLDWQWHPELTVVIVNHGDISLCTQKKSQIIKAGEGVIINSNLMHQVKPVSEDANSSIYHLTFNSDFIFNPLDQVLREKYLDPIINNKTFTFLHLRDDEPTGSDFLDTINLIIADNLIKKAGFELSTKSRLCSLWLQLFNYISGQNSAKKTSKSMSIDELRVKEMIGYMEENYGSKITLDDLSKLSNISKSECCRCFKRVLDTSPVEYLLRLRVSKAAQILREGTPVIKSYSDLSSYVGFNNASYFNKVFRQYIGCTPSEYKRNHKPGSSTDPFNPI